MELYVFSPLLIVSVINLTMRKLPYAPAESFPMDDYVMVNFCESGCCETMLEGQQSFFVKPGDCCLCVGSCSSGVVQQQYPLDAYKGIEIFLHKDILEDPFLSNLKETGLSVSDWMEPLKLKPVSFSQNPQLNHIMKTIRERTEAEDAISLKIAIMDLLRYIDVNGIPEHTHIVHYSNAQISIARQVHDIICTEPGEDIDLKQLASRFSISSSTLNKYFMAIYGEYIPSFQRKVRMNKAAELLLDSDLSVGIISAKMGYQNPGKFSQVFKKYYGLSPLAYRKSKRNGV